MSRKKLEIPEDYLNHNPYKSIINILEIAPSFHKAFKGGLKPGQLMHILVKGFSIEDSSYKLLDRFRLYLRDDKNVKLDQSIAGNHPHQGFNKYLVKLKEFGWIETGKKGRILLADKYRFEPIRIWHRDLIMSCPIDRLVSYNNSTIFHPDIYFTKAEQSEIKDFVWNINKPVMEFFRKIGLQKAGSEWSKFINRSDAPPDIKFYFWFKIIYVHYLASLRPQGIADRTNYFFDKKEIYPIHTEVVMALKHNDFEELSTNLFPFGRSENTPSNWQRQFRKLLESVVKKIYPSFTGNKLRYYEKEFKKMIEKTLMIRIKSEYTTLTIRPETLSYFHMINVEGMDKEKAGSISASAVIEHTYHDSSSYPPENPPQGYLEDTTLDRLLYIFDGLDDEIKKLRYKHKEELCSDLLRLAIAFEGPVLD